jgi:Holliday junction resolvase RusA-like endonuclease
MHNSPHSYRPDGDNLEKFLNDSLNGVLWTDDANIAIMVRIKSYCKSKHGETVIYAKELPFGAINYDEITQIIKENMVSPDE